MKLGKRQIQVFNVFTIFLLIFSLILPGFVGAQGSKTSAELSNAVNPAELKVSKELVEQFEEDEKVTFLVKFSEETDLDTVVQKAEEQAKSQSLSAYSKKMTQRSMVISELKTTALESQGNVKTILRNKKG